MEKITKSIITTKKLLTLLLLATCTISACEKDNDNNVDGDINDTITVSDYPVVGTNQTKFYNNSSEISSPARGEAFYGQDAVSQENTPNYTNNNDGTITDNITGLIWQQDPGEKTTYEEAVQGASGVSLAGYNDWRLPSIKELYSLIIFSGIDPSGYEGTSTDGLVPFIDTDYFDFEYGNIDNGERIIDAQFATTTLDVGDSQFGGGGLMFGVNFADGRIKGYPTGPMPGQEEGKLFYVIYVRGNTKYGINNFVDNGDGTITDNATGLMWMQNDSQEGLNWENALSYAENLEFGNYSDWRLPNAKELQSLVDYTRAPGTTNSAAIDPLFSCTEIINEGGQADYSYYWSGTTHANWSDISGGNAAYISFGRALGYFNYEWMDVHGAGAQRSDPKTGSADDYPTGHGPQGDAIRILNYVRCVRDVNLF